ncbi:MAG: exodeoxyribonuclease III [Acidiferrobacterales bacterium]|jgi:exodeoxyribonuclease-3
MRIVSINLNGIRAAAAKGFYGWLSRQDADVVCLQELRAQVEQLTAQMLAPRGYHGYFHDAEKKGYSGVAVYCRRQPDRIRMGMGWPDMDAEGRYIQADFGELSVTSVYLPSGTSGEARQAVKFSFLDRFMPFLHALRRDGREYILCGDWNIAHKEIDLKNWRANQTHSGFLPEERAWMEKLFNEVGFVDVFRRLNPEPEQYTWWSNRGQAWAKNVGWRIDYHVATPGIAQTARAESIYKRKRFSDHAPLIIDYEYSL